MDGKLKDEDRFTGPYIDDEERELIEAIENSDISQWESFLTPERKAELQQMARNTFASRSKKITMRINEGNLLRLKAMALREGIPYQTLINSILHKAVHGKGDN